MNEKLTDGFKRLREVMNGEREKEVKCVKKNINTITIRVGFP